MGTDYMADIKALDDRTGIYTEVVRHEYRRKNIYLFVTLIMATIGLLITACSPIWDIVQESMYTAPDIEATRTRIGETGEVETSLDEEENMRITLTTEDTVITATLIDGETTQDFISLLPLTLTLEDYAGTEKISDLPRRLSTEGAPAGSDASVGDITYYAPWGNLAIFYRDFRYASGLIILGKIDADVELFRNSEVITVTIDLASTP